MSDRPSTVESEFVRTVIGCSDSLIETILKECGFKGRDIQGLTEDIAEHTAAVIDGYTGQEFDQAMDLIHDRCLAMGMVIDEYIVRHPTFIQE